MWNSNLIQRPLFVAYVSIVPSNLHGNDILGFIPESLLLSGIIQMVVVHATRSQGCMGSLSCAVWAESSFCFTSSYINYNCVRYFPGPGLHPLWCCHIPQCWRRCRPSPPAPCMGWAGPARCLSRGNIQGAERESNHAHRHPVWENFYLYWISNFTISTIFWDVQLALSYWWKNVDWSCWNTHPFVFMDFCVKALEGAFNKEKALLAIVGTFYNQCDSTDQCGVHGVLEHGVDEDGEPVGEDEVGDEESPAHRPQQQQDVERLGGSLTMST